MIDGPTGITDVVSMQFTVTGDFLAGITSGGGSAQVLCDAGTIYSLSSFLQDNGDGTYRFNLYEKKVTDTLPQIVLTQALNYGDHYTYTYTGTMTLPTEQWLRDQFGSAYGGRPGPLYEKIAAGPLRGNQLMTT